MAYDIRLVKLINGETVLGKWDEAENKLTEVAMLQDHSLPAGRADDAVALRLSL